MILRAITLRLIIVLSLASTFVSCGPNDSEVDAQHQEQQRANHLRRVAWQKAHPHEWAAEKARLHAEELARAAAKRRLHAEELAGAETKRQARAAAAEKAVAQAQYAAAHTPCKEFARGLESVQVGSILASYDCSSPGNGIVSIHITVRDEAWESADYDERLRLAKDLWAMCVKYAHPDQADSCHVKLVGEAGEDLGGSNDFFGSVIDVSKD